MAEEVGNLAQMSGNAAKEISEMLTEGVSRANSVVNETQEKVTRLMTVGKQKVENGMGTARRSGEVFGEIVQQVTQVTDMVSEITSAIREQTSGTDEITKAINMFNSSTQQNSQVTAQVTEIADTVLNESAHLAEVVAKLEVLAEVTSAPHLKAKAHAQHDTTSNQHSSKKAA